MDNKIGSVYSAGKNNVKLILYHGPYTLNSKH